MLNQDRLTRARLNSFRTMNEYALAYEVLDRLLHAGAINDPRLTFGEFRAAVIAIVADLHAADCCTSCGRAAA